MATSVDAKLLKSTKFPPEFSQKVDMQKVNVEVMKKWIAGKISEILGSEDDIVIELCFNLLEGSRYPDIKVLQIQLTGFLDRETARFCKDLWLLCLSAQSNPQGVPKELLEAKKLELIQEKIAAEKAAKEADKRKENEQFRERQVNTTHGRERDERSRRGRGRGDRDHYDYPRRPLRVSRSPPRQRRSPGGWEDSRIQRREVDTYIPSGARRRPSPPPLQRSVSSGSSQSPPPRSHRDYRRSRHQYSSDSRSPTPRRHKYRDRGKRTRSYRGDRRHRSPSYSDNSRSPSPRPSHKRFTRSPSSDSATPPRVRRPSLHEFETHHARASSRSSSKDRQRRSERIPSSYDSEHKTNGRHADGVKGRESSLSPPPRQRNLSIGRKDRRDRLTPPPLSRSRSRDRQRRRSEKRRRSRERYAPPAQRRPNTSSVSSPDGKRRKMADSSEAEDTTKKTRRDEHDESPVTNESTSMNEKETDTTYNHRREQALREQLKAMRRND